MTKQRFEIEANIPEGFEPTGEYRFPDVGDWVFVEGSVYRQQAYTQPPGFRIILRKLPPATVSVELPREVADHIASGYCCTITDVASEACRAALEAEATDA